MTNLSKAKYPILFGIMMTMATIVSNPQVFAQEPPPHDEIKQCREDCKILYDVARNACNDNFLPGVARGLCHLAAATAYASCLLACKLR